MAAARALLVMVAIGQLAARVAAAGIGPQVDQGPVIARSALTEARQLVDQQSRLPREAVFDIGLLQALLGEFEAGVATITAAADTAGPGGPRWVALAEAARATAAKGQPELVQTVAERQKGADRAALLVGLARAQLAADNTPLALLNLQEVGGLYPALAANELLSAAEEMAAAGKTPPTEVYSRALDLARVVPGTELSGGQPSQALLLGRLVALHAAAGNDDAALQAAEAVTDPDQRQGPLAEVARCSAAAGRFERAVDAARKLSTEQADPASGASRQVTALAAVSKLQEGAMAVATARLAAEAAKRAVDNYVRVRSLLTASEALSAAGEQAAASALAAQALSDIHVTAQGQRATALLHAARAQALAGQREVAEATFRAAREVVALAKDPATYNAAVAVPAAIGLVGEAKAGLALRKDPASLIAGRLVLARTLAAHGYPAEAIAVAQEFDATRPDEKLARIQALVAVATPERGLELLREAVKLASEAPLDLASLRLIAARAESERWPEIALAVYAAATESAAKTARPEAELGLAELAELTARTVSSRFAPPPAAYADALALGELATLAEQTLGSTQDPMTRSAGLATVGGAVCRAGDRAGGERLLAAAAKAAREVTPEDRQIRALAEHGAAAAGCGYVELAARSFTAAEAMLDNLADIGARVLLPLAEAEAQHGRFTAGRFLLRSILTIEGFAREGSSDLRSLAQVAAYVGQPADALAMIRRIYRPEERLSGYLDLARVLIGRPVAPLRQPAGYPLPPVIAIGSR